MKKILLSSTFVALASLNLYAQHTVYDPIDRYLFNEFTSNGLTNYIANVGQPFVYMVEAGNYQADLGPTIDDKKYLFWGVQAQAASLSNFNFSSSQLQPNQKFVVRAKVHAPNVGEDNVDFGIHVTNFENIGAIEDPNSFPAMAGIKTFLGTEYNLVGVNTPTTYQFDITPILPFVASRYASVAFRASNKSVGEKTVILDDLEFGIQPPTTASSDSFFRQNFTLYPNPVNDILTIACQENNEIKGGLILDLNGRIISTFTSNKVNVSNLATGSYILQIESNLGIATTKFIKK